MFEILFIQNYLFLIAGACDWILCILDITVLFFFFDGILDLGSYQLNRNSYVMGGLVQQPFHLLIVCCIRGVEDIPLKIFSPLLEFSLYADNF